MDSQKSKLVKLELLIIKQRWKEDLVLYGHSTLTVKPNLSASGSGLSLSFSPSSSTTKQDFSQHTYGPNGQI